jgi:hypothetical protein
MLHAYICSLLMIRLSPHLQGHIRQMRDLLQHGVREGRRRITLIHVHLHHHTAVEDRTVVLLEGKTHAHRDKYSLA